MSRSSPPTIQKPTKAMTPTHRRIRPGFRDPWEASSYTPLPSSSESVVVDFGPCGDEFRPSVPPSAALALPLLFILGSP